MACLAALGMLVLQNVQVRGHGNYDPACCSDRDCHPVEENVVQERSDGVHVQGHGILSYTDLRLRWSKDDRDHVCEQSTGGGVGAKKLFCVYRKTKGF